MGIKLKSFRWKAVDHLQQKRSGILVCEDVEQAQQYLLGQGLTHIKLQRNWQLNAKPKNSEVCDLLVQLSTLLNAHVTLKQSFQILLENCVNPKLNQWIRDLLKSIESGLSFSQALERYPEFLSHQERQLIRVGELTGKLPQVCAQLAEYKTQSLALQRKIQKILLYPLVVLLISVVLTLLLLIFIVPQFAEMYGDKQNDLPLFTRLLLNISEFLRQNWLILFIVVFSAIIFIKYQLKHSITCYQWKNRLLLITPLLGNILQLSRLIGFCHAVQLMLQSGVPLNQALDSFLPNTPSWRRKNSVIEGDVWLQQQVRSILSRIQQGYSFSQSVSPQLFSSQNRQILQVGEKSGRLGHILQQIAEDEKQRLDHRIDLLSQLLEHLMMVVVGALIGLIMLGMYLPIFNMGNLIQ